jgi:hypothetical protein
METRTVTKTDCRTTAVNTLVCIFHNMLMVAPWLAVCVQNRDCLSSSCKVRVLREKVGCVR